MARRRHGRMNARTCCKRKTKRGNVYATRLEAEAAAWSVSVAFGAAIGAFQCRVCRKFHVGAKAIFHRGTG